jgi:hypothetical protein
VINLKRQEEIEVEKTEKIQFGVPYENTRKHSKFDVLGEDLTVVPVEIEIDSMLYNLIQSAAYNISSRGEIFINVLGRS